MNKKFSIGKTKCWWTDSGWVSRLPGKKRNTVIIKQTVDEPEARAKLAELLEDENAI